MYRIVEDNAKIVFSLWESFCTDESIRETNYCNNVFEVVFDKNNRTFSFWIDDGDGGNGNSGRGFTASDFQRNVLDKIIHTYNDDEDLWKTNEVFHGHQYFDQDTYRKYYSSYYENGYQMRKVANKNEVVLYTVGDGSGFCGDFNFKSEDFYYVIEMIGQLIKKVSE